MKQYKDVKRRILAMLMACMTVFSTMSGSITSMAKDISGIGTDKSSYIEAGGAIAQVYEATKAYEELKSFTFKFQVEKAQSIRYQTAVYQNLQNIEDPTSGVKRYESSISTLQGTGTAQAMPVTVNSSAWAGEIDIAQGETIAVVVTVISATNSTEVKYYKNPAGTTGYTKENGDDWTQDGSSCATKFDITVDDTITGPLTDITSIGNLPNSVVADVSEKSFTLNPTLNPNYLREITYEVTGDCVTVAPDGADPSKEVVSIIKDGIANIKVKAGGQTKNIPVRIVDCDFTSDYAYIGSDITPVLSVKCGSALSASTHYVVNYPELVQAGTYDALVTGVGEYEGYSRSLSYTIQRSEITQAMVNAATFTINTSDSSVSRVSMTDAKDNVLGMDDVTATAELTSIDLSTHERVYKITVEGKGNYTTTTPLVRTNYRVVAGSSSKIDISDVVAIKLDTTTFSYDGSAKEPTFKFVKPDDPSTEVSFASTNYTTAYTNNVDAGKGTLTVKGNGNYTGSLTANFTINKCPLSNTSAIDIKLSRNETAEEITVGGDVYYKHTGNEVKPDVRVFVKGTSTELVQGTHFSVSYTDNKKIGTMYTKITALDNSNYSGSVTLSSEIVGDLEKDAVIEVGGEVANASNGYASAYSASYTGNQIRPNILVTIPNATITEEDYTVSFKSNINAGTATVTITGKAGTVYEDAECSATYTITPMDISIGSSNVRIAPIPNKSYTGSAIKPALTVTRGDRTLVETADYTVTANSVNAGTGVVSIQGTGNYKGTLSANFNIVPLDFEAVENGITLDAVADMTYTGVVVTPDVTVRRNGIPLTKGTDYTVSCTAKDVGPATVTVTGKGNFKGALTGNFNITPKGIEGLNITVGGSRVYQNGGLWETDYATEYSGTEKKPSVVVKDGDVVLSKGTHYSISYTNNVNATTPENKACVTITGKGPYQGSSLVVPFDINPKDISSSSDIEIEITGPNYKSGDYVLPKITVSDNGESLVEGESYDFSLEDMTECKSAGEHKKAVIVGTGNYTGKLETPEYTIGKNLMGKKDTDGKERLSFALVNPYDTTQEYPKITGGYSVTYLGNVTPKAVLKYQEDIGDPIIDLIEDQDYVVSAPEKISGETIYSSGSIVEITYTGIKDYYGEFTVRYLVQQPMLNWSSMISVKNGDDPAVRSYVSKEEGGEKKEVYTYNGESVRPKFKIEYDMGGGHKTTLVEGVDYEISVSEVGPQVTETGVPVTVTGKGNYGSYVEYTYYISESDISASNFKVTPIANKVYTGNFIKLEENELIIVDENTGYRLQEGKDFTMGYADNKAISTVDLPAKVYLTGRGNYKGTRTVNFNIIQRDISKAVVSDIDDQDFEIKDGKAVEICPTYTVYYNGEVLEEGVDYTAVITQNTLPGQAKITITGKGSYTGSITKTFNIIGDISKTALFTVSGVSAAYDLDSAGNLEVSDYSGIEIKYKNNIGGESYVDHSCYDIEQRNCSAPGQGKLVFVGKGYCKGTREIDIDVMGSLDDAKVIGIQAEYSFTNARIEPVPIVQYGKKTLVLGQDYAVEYGANNKTAGVGTGTITINSIPSTETKKVYYNNSKVLSFDIKYDLSTAVIDGIDGDYNYTGNAIEPPVTAVSCAGHTLNSAEYSVAYGENKSAGRKKGSVTVTPSASAATYVINSQTKTFDINGINVSDTVVTIGGLDTGYETNYTGDSIAPDVTVTYGGSALTLNTDYTLRYSNNLNAGEASVTVTGINNYFGAVTETFTIKPISINDPTVKASVSNMGYAGHKPVIPVVSLSLLTNNHTLVQDVDYTIKTEDGNYAVYNNTEVTDNGAWVIITAKGGNFTGSRQEFFSVTTTNLAGGTISIDRSFAYYTGEVLEPTITVKCPVGDGTEYELQENVDYTISNNSGSEIKNAGRYSITVTGKDNFYGNQYVNFEVLQRPLTANGIEVTLVDAEGNEKYEYDYQNGAAIKPLVSVKDTKRKVLGDVDERILVENQDYIIEYENNKESASRLDQTAPPTVKVIGINNYGGEKAIGFDIGTPIDKEGTEAVVRIAENEKKFTYDKKPHVPNYNVYLGDKLLVKDRDYTELSILDGNSGLPDVTNAGTKEIAVRGIGEYFGTVYGEYKIEPKVATISQIRVELKYNGEPMQKDADGMYSVVYTGGAVEPEVEVFDDSISKVEPLTEDNYWVEYKNQTFVGSKANPAYVIVHLKGNYGAGSETKSVPFIITAKGIEEYVISIEDGVTRYPYTGTEVIPEGVSVLYDNGVDPVIKLVEGQDYDLSYSDNVNAGRATITATAKGNYSGVITTNFDIYANLSDANIKIDKQFYTGDEIHPPLDIVCGGNHLVEGRDYTVSYYSDDNYTTHGYAFVTPSDSPYYCCDTSPIQKEYEIVFDTSLLKITGYADRYTYTGKIIRPTFEVYMPDGRKLSFNQSDVTYTNQKGAKDLINVGTITAKIPVKVSSLSAVARVQYQIVPKNINTCSIKQLENNTYTGKSLQPPVSIVYNGRELVQGKEYTTTYSNTIHPGTATVMVAGTGNYTGTAALHFSILSPEIVGLKASSDSTDSIKLSWGRNGTATGYEIYSADAKKRYGSTTGNSYIVKNLKAQTSYSFAVRSYVKVGNKITYGNWKWISSNTKVSSVKLTAKSKTKKQVRLSWAKNTAVDGYEIYQATSKKGKFKKIASMPTNKVTSYTCKKLKSKKKYYYKIRAYKKMNGKYVYGSYSKVKSVTVK